MRGELIYQYKYSIKSESSCPNLDTHNKTTRTPKGQSATRTMKTKKPHGEDILIMIIASFTIATVAAVSDPTDVGLMAKPISVDSTVREMEKDLPQNEPVVAKESNYEYATPTYAYTYPDYKKQETKESWYFIFGLLIGGVIGMMICSLFTAKRQSQRELIRRAEE